MESRRISAAVLALVLTISREHLERVVIKNDYYISRPITDMAIRNVVESPEGAKKLYAVFIENINKCAVDGVAVLDLMLRCDSSCIGYAYPTLKVLDSNMLTPRIWFSPVSECDSAPSGFCIGNSPLTAWNCNFDRCFQLIAGVRFCHHVHGKCMRVVKFPSNESLPLRAFEQILSRDGLDLRVVRYSEVCIVSVPEVKCALRHGDE
jgi:hypothetical protein